MNQTKLERELERLAGDPQLTGWVVSVAPADPSAGDVSTFAGGEATSSTPFFIASVTKLYTNAIVLGLCDEDVVSLDDRIVDVIPDLPPLHVDRGADRTGSITIEHLLSHTSGLADYFAGEPDGSPSLEDRLRKHEDQSWTFDDALEIAASLPARFAPGSRNKAYYSDTNHQLLGRIIEQATGDSFATTLEQRVLDPLGLANTWLYVDAADDRPLPLRDGDRELRIPQAMTSFGPDGGVVADAADLMAFLRAYFEGDLFNGARLQTMTAQ